MLRMMGFGDRWIKWIKYSITTVKYSVLVNRSPVGFFSPQKGIRQGDPLSPFLFILAMEGLSKMLDRAKQLQWIEGFTEGNNIETSVSVSHLLYADDTLIFCGAERSQVEHLNLTLLIFEAISGLHINMLKSVIYPVNTVPDLHDLAEQLCCSVGSFPTTYLGLPLGAKYKSIDIWSSVIEKVEKRLATWQRQYLSMGGRLTLINSVMDSIPTYLMSLFSLPSKVLKQLDKVRRNFLWEGNSEGHKFHLVKWCNVVRPKLQGGLGIRDLAKHNKSMLLKWIWRYGMEGNSLWKEVVAAKHGELNHWCTKQSNSPHGVGAWKHIRKYWEDFVHQISFKVGNGLNVKFWKDRWLGNSILKELYPNLFLIARDPDSTVAQNREDNQWNLLFRRNFNDWELGSLFELMGRLEGYNMNPQATDIICWGPKAKEYTVKKGYKLLHAQNDITDLWPWKLIWKTKLPPKATEEAQHLKKLIQDYIASFIKVGDKAGVRQRISGICYMSCMQSRRSFC